jgi:hypothetical protein
LCAREWNHIYWCAVERCDILNVKNALFRSVYCQSCSYCLLAFTFASLTTDKHRTAVVLGPARSAWWSDPIRSTNWPPKPPNRKSLNLLITKRVRKCMKLTSARIWHWSSSYRPLVGFWPLRNLLLVTQENDRDLDSVCRILVSRRRPCGLTTRASWR